MRAAAVWLPRIGAHVADSTLFLACILCVLWMARRRLTASARHALVVTGMLKFAIPIAAVRALLPARPLPSLIVSHAALGRFALASQPAPSRIWPAVLLGSWLAVALLLWARWTLTRHRLVTLVVRTARPASAREIEAFARAHRALHVRRSVDVARSALAEAPAVLRIVRPLVVLPARGCDELSDGELEALLRHEAGHVARHDNLIARIESLVGALFWFHPLLWVAQRITALERERACDELAAATADERDTYLAALRKFCHAAIAPPLPGVSCMATAKLKERIDHVMEYPRIKANAPSPRRVTIAAVAAMVAFTVAAGLFVPGRAVAQTAPGNDAYAIRMSVNRLPNGTVLAHAVVSDPATGIAVFSPTVGLQDSPDAKVVSDDGRFVLQTSAAADGAIAVDVNVSRDGNVIQNAHAVITPSMESHVYQGEPISMTLHDADLRDVIHTFGKLTGLIIDIDPSVRGTVDVNWVDVPWDQAFDTLLKENGCAYSLDGNRMHVTKQ
ncbi:MAG: secretin and TonB N-terminal domain-containing protein [Acidobacteria bacterium]|nr:secretin and TonB N-terminal domain-containing protein [Acidobacteriota bacterium]MBV9478026.1 secretin and TonB N-terminal domain-containing protein [Acidobacteriota bacterium]